jgi:outer membrane protein TolC
MKRTGALALLVAGGLGVIAMCAPARSASSEGESYLLPEWRVGQDQTSASDLEVTPVPEVPAELTIQDAVAIALRNNVGFRSSIQQLLSARSAYWVARQQWNLELFADARRAGDGETTDSRDAGANFSYAALTGANFSVSAALSSIDQEESESSVRATFSQPLLAGAGRASAAYESLRRARNAYRAALISFYQQRQDLVSSVISAYFGAVEQQQLVENQKNSVMLAEQSVRDAELRLEAGMIAEIDLLRAQLSLARAQTAEIGQEQSMQDAMDRLSLRLGVKVGGTPDLVTVVSYKPLEMDLDAAVAQALELQPELRLSDLGIENKEAALRISRSRALPSLDLVAGWSRTQNDLRDTDWYTGLELTVPIASRALRDDVWNAQWALLVAQQQREQLRQQVIADVRSQFRAAQAARANVDIAQKSVEMAQRSLYYARRMVEEGLRTNRDLLDAQDDLTRSSNLLVSSKINYYLALMRLRQAIGLDVAQDLPTGLKSQQPPAPPMGLGGEAPGGETGAVTPAAPAAGAPGEQGATPAPEGAGSEPAAGAGSPGGETQP